MAVVGTGFAGNPLVAVRPDGAIELSAAAGVTPVAVESPDYLPGVLTGYLRDFQEFYGFLGLAPPNRYCWSVDGGLSWRWWNGVAWGLSDGSYAQSNPASDLTNPRLLLFANPSGRLAVRVWLAGAPPDFPVFNGFQVAHDAAFLCPSVRPGRDSRDLDGVVLVTGSELGTERRRGKRPAPRRVWSLSWTNLEPLEVQLLEAWFDDHLSLTAFGWMEPEGTVVSVRFNTALAVTEGSTGASTRNSAAAQLVEVL